MPSNHFIFCHAFLLPPSILPRIRIFSSESVLHIRQPNYQSISPSSEYSGLISFRMDWLDLLAVQGISRVFSNTTVQKHHSLVLSFLYIVQLSHPYMTTGKTIALIRWAFVGKVMSLLFNMLSAAAAKLHSPTLCNPRDGSPPASAIPGILQAGTLGWS